MAAIETWWEQDLKKPVQVKQLTGTLFGGDSAANVIGVEVTNDGTPVSISGSVTGYVIRDDGVTIVIQGTASGNRASITLTASCYDVVGPISIVIKNDATTIGACTTYVYRTSTDL